LPMAAKQNRRIHHRGTEAQKRSQEITSALNLSMEVLLLRFSVPLW
jgi:hypothetical protein